MFANLHTDTIVIIAQTSLTFPDNFNTKFSRICCRITTSFIQFLWESYYES